MIMVMMNYSAVFLASANILVGNQ